jgi:hypothetical protein
MKTKDFKKAAANDVDLEQSTETNEINNDQLIADAQKMVDDLKIKLAAARVELKKLTGKKSSEKRSPGVIATILTLVTESGKTGISKADILAKLVEMFPDRAADGMSKTINVQIPNRLERERNVKIVKLENGNYAIGK